MQIYRTTADTESHSLQSWQGSLSDASKARTAYKAQGYRSTSEPVEVPTNKAGLLAWLNENVNS